MQNPEPVYSQAAIEMFTVANEYCIFIESAQQYPQEEVRRYLNKILPLMYLKGSLLPEVEVEYPEANERYVTAEQWEVLFNELRFYLANSDIFVSIDPTGDASEITRQSLAENLTDIYQDMKDFVLLFSKESAAAKENALNSVAALFRSHWGHRVLNSLNYLHYILHEGFIDNEEMY